LSELVVDAPVAIFAGIGQRAAADVSPQAEMVEPGRLRAQTRFDIAQALPIGQLREGKTQELVQATEATNVEVAPILPDQMTKGVPRRELHHLREHELACVHRFLSGNPGKDPATGASSSNR